MPQKTMEEVRYVKKKKGDNPFCSVVIVAGGKGVRMESKINKVYLDLCGKKAILRTLEVFEECSCINEIILVVNQRDLEFCNREILEKNEFLKLKKILVGGVKRQDSVYNGLKEISEDAEIVLIHDGARPLVTNDIIERSIFDVLEYKAVTVGMPAKDTIKSVNDAGFITGTPDRSTLWLVQTPQVFLRSIIFEAYKCAQKDGIEATDDAALVERIGYKIKMTEGSYENIKLTTPEDVALAEAIIRYREG